MPQSLAAPQKIPLLGKSNIILSFDPWALMLTMENTSIVKKSHDTFEICGFFKSPKQTQDHSENNPAASIDQQLVQLTHEEYIKLLQPGDQVSLVFKSVIPVAPDLPLIATVLWSEESFFGTDICLNCESQSQVWTNWLSELFIRQETLHRPLNG